MHGSELEAAFGDDHEPWSIIEADAARSAVEGPLAERLYRDMLRSRLVDERLVALQRQGRIGFCGTAFGQEAVPVGTAHAAAATDWVFPALREGALLLARGAPLVDYIAQCFGTSGDVAKGRQMPSHQFSRRHNVVSWSSCIGTQLPQAVGAAYAARLKGDDVAVVAFLGDGATSVGDFHAALNFAGVWRVPCVFVCQNNQYAISLPVARQTRAASLASKGRAYGVPAARVDGNDVVAVWLVVREALVRARRGEGSTFIECVTYRQGPHSSSDDPSRYRTEQEEAGWSGRDPIARMKAHLESRGSWSAERDSQLRDALTASIKDAIQEAEGGSAVTPESLFDDVFETQPWHLVEQARALRQVLRPASE